MELCGVHGVLVVKKRLPVHTTDIVGACRGSAFPPGPLSRDLNNTPITRFIYIYRVISPTTRYVWDLSYSHCCLCLLGVDVGQRHPIYQPTTRPEMEGESTRCRTQSDQDSGPGKRRLEGRPKKHSENSMLPSFIYSLRAHTRRSFLNEASTLENKSNGTMNARPKKSSILSMQFIIPNPPKMLLPRLISMDFS